MTRWLSDARIPCERYQVVSISTFCSQVDVDELSACDHQRAVEPTRAAAEHLLAVDAVALDVRRRAFLRERVRAPHAEQVVLRVDPVECEPLIGVQVPLEDPARRSRPPSATARTSPHSSSWVGGGVRAPASLSAAKAAWGKAGVRVEQRGVGGDLLQHVADGKCGHAACTTPGWKFGFPSGIGTGQVGVSGPGSSPWPRACSTSFGMSAAVACAVSRRAPTLMPSWASTIPP